jgi:hypothetical protein
MADSETPEGLQPSDFTEQRNEALREGVKGLFLMNGGGAVALLGRSAARQIRRRIDRRSCRGCCLGRSRALLSLQRLI